MTMTKRYYDKDADTTVLKGKKIGILGYGNQGRAQALNMKDSGISDIQVGTAKDETYDQALDDGFNLVDIPELVIQSDIIFMLIPDEIMPGIYEDHVKSGLRPGMALNFASGYNITFRHIVPPADVDVIMVAPRMIGDGVRNLFLEKKGYPAYVAIEQDASGKARAIALALAKSMGATRIGSMEVSFKDETMMDLLAEQAIWPMILSVLTESFKFQVEKGHPSEASLVELYMSKEPAYMLEKMAEMGIYGQMPLHSHTSQYGQLSRSEALDKSFIRKTLEEAYDYLEKGKFAREWKNEQENGMLEFKRLMKNALESDISLLEQKILKKQ